MKLNVCKTKTMIVFCSHTIHSQSTPLTLDGTVLKETPDLVMSCVTLDAKMTFAQRLGIMRKSCQVFHDRSLYLRSLWCFVLPV